MSKLVIKNLKASVAGTQILHGIDLEINSGEVHAIMGPNGSGKSTLSNVLMGKADYTDISGSVTIDGVELLDIPTFERARAGLFLCMQYPVEVPGVSMVEAMSAALGKAASSDIQTALQTEASRVGFDVALLERPLNVDLSGGERKRNETVQLSVIKPKFAVLDEIDSGLDVDALRDVARRVEAATDEFDLGVLAITHYSRLLEELKPDQIHVLSAGKIVRTGGPEIAAELEASGYASYAE